MDDDFSQLDDDFEDELGAAGMAVLARLAGLVRRVDWFGRTATPLDAATAAAGRAYLDALGFPHAAVATIDDWTDAMVAAESSDYDNPAWEAEEQLRGALAIAAAERLGEAQLAELTDAVDAVTAAAAAEAAAGMAARCRIDDEAFVTAAVGAAVHTVHLVALVLLAGEDAEDHPFVHRFHLFEAGRWPLGIAGSSLNVF